MNKQTGLISYLTRLQVPDPVLFRETPKPRNDDPSPPEFRMAPVIGELSPTPKANNASVERRWHRGTPYDVNWRSSGYTPTSFVFHMTSWRHITTCVTESEWRNGKDCTERIPGLNDRNQAGIRKSGRNSAGTCILVIWYPLDMLRCLCLGIAEHTTQHNGGARGFWCSSLSLWVPKVFYVTKFGV